MSRSALGFSVALTLVAVAACGAFVGSATEKGSAYTKRCGDFVCDIDDECSVTKPVKCVPHLGGKARDAGQGDAGGVP